MQKHLRKITLVSIALFCTIPSGIVLALNQEEETSVRQNCVSVQVVLQRMQYSDAANRVKRGQAYENILSNFMLPLNSRTASNGLSAEAARLSEITDRYQQNLIVFKDEYDKYADKIDALIRMKCKDMPQSFYDRVQEARENRGKIAANITTLDQIIEEYRIAVNQVKRSVEE